MKLEIEKNLKYVFLFIHAAFLTAGLFYLQTSQITYGIYFVTASVLGLNYYTLYQEIQIQRRLEAHLNLIDEAIQESEEFKQGVKKKKTGTGDSEMSKEELEELLDTAKQQIQNIETQGEEQ